MTNNIFRLKKTGKFTVIPNSLFNDARLSLKAIGLHSSILSKPDDWTVMIDDIVRSHKDGRDSVYSAIKELISAGYWVKYPVRAGNRIESWQTDIYELPVTEPQKRIAKVQKYAWGYIVTYEDGHAEKYDLNDERLEKGIMFGPDKDTAVQADTAPAVPREDKQEITKQSVLPEKPEVEHFSADFELPKNLLPEKPEVEQPYFNNKYLETKDVSFTQSIRQSQYADRTATDGQTESEQNELEDIFTRCDFASGYLESGIVPFVQNTITHMFYAESITVGKARYPQQKVRRLLRTVEPDHIVNALTAFRKAKQPIKNVLGYFASALYNEIATGEDIFFIIGCDEYNSSVSSSP